MRESFLLSATIKRKSRGSCFRRNDWRASFTGKKSLRSPRPLRSPHLNLILVPQNTSNLGIDSPARAGRYVCGNDSSNSTWVKEGASLVTWLRSLILVFFCLDASIVPFHFDSQNTCFQRGWPREFR